MKHLTHQLRSVCLFCAGPVVAALLFADLAAAMRGPLHAKGQTPLFTVEAGTVEIRFPAPKRYAVVQDERNKIRRLYTTGDVLFHPQNPMRSVRIQRVDPGGMVCRESHTSRERSLRPGHPVPGFPGVTFVGTVMLTQLQYRFKMVDRITQADPVLVSLVGSHAIVEKEVLPLPPARLVRPAPTRPPPQTNQRTLDPELFQQVRVKEMDEDTYELDEATLGPVIATVGQMLANLRTGITPTVSSETGLGLNMITAVGDGILSRRGFTVTRIAVAQTFGIQVGDTIVSLNGRPVNSPLNAWRIFQELFTGNQSLTTLHVKLVRGESLLTKTYRIR